MDVDKNDLRLYLFQKLIGYAKRVVIRGHKNPPLKIHHRVWHIALRALVHARTRHSRCIIRWSKQTASGTVGISICRFEVIDDLSLVPNVVAGRDYVNPKLEKVFR